MEKLLDELIQQRLQSLFVGENGLSENQFGFRKGRSTGDAIQAVVDVATKATIGTVKRKGFCALISIDIRDALNTARWEICIEAMVEKKVPACLLRMIHNYLSERWEIYEGDKWSFKEKVTCTSTSFIGFADNGIVVCAAEDVRILELRSMKACGAQSVSWTASANTYRSRLPKPSNVKQTWLGSCQTLMDPRK